MAKELNYDRLSQVDSNISKYFSKHMASTLVREKQNLERKQAEEVEKLRPKYQSADQAFMFNGGIGITSKDLALSESKEKGTWSKKNTEDLINEVRKKWMSDSRTQDDISTLTNAFYVELCRAKNGGRDSKKLADYAQRYVDNRINTLIVEQLARQKVPMNTLDYVGRHAFEGCLVGSLFSAVQGGTHTDEKVNEKVEELYGANWAEKALGIGGSLGIDATTSVVGIGGSVVSWGAKKLGVSATRAAVTGKVTAVAADAAFHLDEYSTDSEQYIKEETEKVLGDKDAVKKIQDGGQKYRKGQTEFQAQVDSMLYKKIKIKPQEFNDDTKHVSNALLRNHRGNSARVLENIRKDFKDNGIAIGSQSLPPKWMFSFSAKKNRAMSASYYAIAMEMKENATARVKVGGQYMTLSQVAKRAHDYANAAAMMDKPGTMANFNAKTRQASGNMLRSIKGDNDKLIAEIQNGLWRNGILGFKVGNVPPSWMLHGKTAQEDRQLATKFYNMALEMAKTGKESIKVKGGKVMTLQQVAQRAYDYACAANAVEKLGFDNDKVSSAVLQRRMEAREKQIHKMVKSTRQDSPGGQYAETSSSPSGGYFAQPATSYAEQPAQATAQTDSLGNVKDLTSGWGNALEQLGLGGFGKNGRDIGYVMAMLPDMLIGMFTGKNPDMKLGDNLLPIASIIGGSFMKRHPLLRMMLMGYGGVSILNSAGKAALKQRDDGTNPQKVYKSYPDEALSSRITNPVLKGRSLVANIDGKPMVLNISEDAVKAHLEGKVPLNTLANAVLRKYDENRSLAQHHYEDEMSNSEVLQQGKQLK